MATNEEEFYKELLAMYKIEAEEHIKAISSGLLELEKLNNVNQQPNIIETVYREAHSLKGASRAVNLTNIEMVCQSLETILAAVKRQNLDLAPELFDVLFKAIDVIGDLVESPDTVDISEIMQKLSHIEDLANKRQPQKEKVPSKKEPVKKQAVKKKEKQSGKILPKSDVEIEEEKETEPKVQEPNTPEESITPEVQTSAIPEREKALVSDTIRIAISKLDSLLLEAEEMLSAKLISIQHATDIKNIVNDLDLWKKEWERKEADIHSVRKEIEKNDITRDKTGEDLQLTKLVDFINWNFDHTKSIEEKLLSMSKLADDNARMLGNMVDTLLDDMKKVLMLPFSTLLKILPKVVRDLSRDQGKEVELIVRGSTIEIDRRILEELKDPFIHLIRNCIDHGIEKPEERKRRKKSTCGTISMAISQLGGNKVEIIISDDGGGIDKRRVQAVAIKKGIIREDEAQTLSDQDILMLIFQSEVSTSPIITDISGRGLGMPIVREKVEKLGGTMSLETEIGLGTNLRIVLPVTLATFRGILIQVSGQSFVLPTLNVDRVLRIDPDDIKTVENRETIVIDEKPISFINLADVLDLPIQNQYLEDSTYIQGILIGSGEKQIAFGVERIQSEQEVLVKTFGKQLSRIRNIAGATILGTGKVVPILNVADLMKSAVKVAKTPTKVLKTEEVKVDKPYILVVEDSITSRTLLKNILESAGYRVKTTVDGVDALTALRSEDFDLVVSDIEMPRMNGFDLVDKIRGDKKTVELPVILVTALESREDRERGIDVGANAYIVKRSFDQSMPVGIPRKWTKPFELWKPEQ